MGVAPAKIIFVVILLVEVALVSSLNIIIVTKNLNKQVYGKFVILQSLGIIAIKSSETRAVIYTCRYSSGLLLTLVYIYSTVTCFILIVCAA